MSTPLSGKPERVVCVMTARRPDYSETFVSAHIEKLPATVKLVYGDPFPARVDGDAPLFSTLHRAWLRIAEEFGLPGRRSPRLARYWKHQRVDAVLAEYGTNGVRAYRACRQARIPLVVHFHGYDAYRQDLLDTLRREYSEMFRVAAALIAVSRDMERQLVALGAPHDKVFYNPCGVDLERFETNDPGLSEPNFVAVGRFVEKKGPLLTLLAFERAAAVVPQARLTMVGDGRLLEACQQLADALRIADRVTFTGALPHPQIAQHLGRARAFVQHSLTTSDGNSEGTPVAILEAGAAGLPVVATAHGGIVDCVRDGETGFLVPSGDVEAMAQRMIELAQEPKRAAEMGRRARAHIAASFSQARSIERLWTIIEAAIRGEAGSIRSVP